MTHLIKRATYLDFKFPETQILPVVKNIMLPLILFILAAMSGCKSANEGPEIDNTSNGLASLQNAPGIGDTSNELVSLQNARNKWRRHSGQYYMIQSQRICECLPEMSADMKISVLDNLVLSAVDINSDEVISKKTREQIITVENLFVLIEKAIEDNISVEVSYNEADGYPEIARIDVEQLAVDGGLYIKLSELVLHNSRSALDDVSWTLISFDSIAGTQPVIKNTQVTMSIDLETMQLSGNAGCNNYSADFVLDDESHNITISNVIRQEMWCDEPKNLMQQEQNYFATLALIRFFSFNKATLNIGVGGDAGLHLVATNRHQ